MSSALLRDKIATLQAELELREAQETADSLEPQVLVPNSPTKKKVIKPIERQAKSLSQSKTKGNVSNGSKAFPALPSATPRRLLEATVEEALDEDKVSYPRTTAFQEKPTDVEEFLSMYPHSLKEGIRQKNIAKAQFGPRDFPTETDWDSTEPHSGTRLRSRALAHEMLSMYMEGRYYVPPSLLYQIVVQSNDKATYDMPLAGDWITLAVIAEKKDIATTRQSSRDLEKVEQVQEEDGPESASDEDLLGSPGRKRKRKQKQQNGWQPRKKAFEPSKYVSCKLVDFGTSARHSGSNVLNMIMFQSKREGDDENPIYVGGSRGAFEKWCTLPEGTLIALLNPDIMAPMAHQGTGAVYALRPSSADSLIPIGMASDFVRCQAGKQDGTTCGSWADARVSSVCSYHLLAHMKKSKSARAEFALDTGGPASKKQYQHSNKLIGQPSSKTSKLDGSTSYVIDNAWATATPLVEHTAKLSEKAKKAKDIALQQEKVLRQQLLSGSIGKSSKPKQNIMQSNPTKIFLQAHEVKENTLERVRSVVLNKLTRKIRSNSSSPSRFRFSNQE